MSLALARSEPDPIVVASDRAVRRIPPAWPLASSVAVNPYVGQLDDDLPTAAARLARTAGCRITMPRQWYLDRIANGEISATDLREAWSAASPDARPADVGALITDAADPALPAALPTVADLAAEATGVDWPRIISARLGGWAAAWFAEGPALWPLPRGRSAGSVRRCHALPAGHGGSACVDVARTHPQAWLEGRRRP